MLAPSLFFFLCAIITIARSETAIQAEQKQIFPNLQLEQNKYTLYNTKQFDSSLKHVSCDSSSSLIHLHFKTIHAARKFEKKLTNANNQQVVLMMNSEDKNQCEKNKLAFVKQHEITNNAVVRLVTDKQISQDEWIKDFGFDYTPPNDDENIIVQNDETMGKDIQQMSKDIKPPQKEKLFVAARDDDDDKKEKNYFVFSSSSAMTESKLLDAYWKRNVAVAAVIITVTIGVFIWLIANRTCGKKNEEFKNGNNDVDADIENILRSEVGYGAVDVM